MPQRDAGEPQNILGWWYPLNALYPLLSRLKNDGLLCYEWQESTQGPPRKYYALTPQGVEFLAGLDAAWSEIENTVGKLKTETYIINNV